MQQFTAKRPDVALGAKTFTSTDGKATYIVFKTFDGRYHTFVETEAKEAARACGAKPGRNTQSELDSLWDK